MRELARLTQETILITWEKVLYFTKKCSLASRCRDAVAKQNMQTCCGSKY